MYVCMTYLFNEVCGMALGPLIHYGIVSIYVFVNFLYLYISLGYLK